jgi:3-(3-hydroxy-phenyl)propionate hydroxylase
MTYDVAIVGYGPVGAVLANLLGQRGLRVLVVERETSVYHLPRAAHFDGEIMRVFQAIGLAEAVLPSTSLISAYEFVNADRDVLLHFDGTDGHDSSGWMADYFFYQPDLEMALRAGVERFPSVEVRLGTAVTDVRDLGHAVELALDDGEIVRAAWVVGCDGGRSLVRAAAGIGVKAIGEGPRGFEEDWLVVDVEVHADADAHLDDVAYQICDPARPVTQIPMPPPHRRWEFMLVGDDTPEAMQDPVRVASLLAPWLAPDQYEVVRAVVYRFHALLADCWRAGRLLLAGDAAHQMPPFLGQGMCAGIRDAANLAWKLARVVAGEADDSLLDTYEPERRPHVRGIIETAVALGGFICTTDPAVAATRDEMLLGGGAPEAPDRYPPLGPGHWESGPGRQIPQVWVEVDGAPTRLDDLLGLEFATVTATAVNGRPIVDRSGELAAWLEKHGASAVVVRPDRYVHAVAAEIA